MEDPTTTTLSQETPPTETLGRRQLLKAIAATGGAVAASTLLPGEWAKPVVEVGVLPAHAQVSVAFSMLCDSTPGGGDLGLVDGNISRIQPILGITAGSGSLGGITGTMTVEVVTAPLPSFDPSLPRTAITNSSGRADFGSLQVTRTTGNYQAFNLVFDFETPVGTVHATCGIFYFRGLD